VPTLGTDPSLPRRFGGLNQLVSGTRSTRAGPRGRTYQTERRIGEDRELMSGRLAENGPPDRLSGLVASSQCVDHARRWYMPLREEYQRVVYQVGGFAGEGVAGRGC
jgi:hypothetical protein